jgi:hypothetical protein
MSSLALSLLAFMATGILAGPALRGQEVVATGVIGVMACPVLMEGDMRHTRPPVGLATT